MKKLSNKIMTLLALVLVITLAVPNTVPVVEAGSKVAAVKSFRQTDSTKTSVTLKWKKVSGANGYQIQLKSGGEFKTVKTIQKAGTTSYTHKKLKADKSYSFRIRAYKKVGGKKKYGSWKKLTAYTDESEDDTDEPTTEAVTREVWTPQPYVITTAAPAPQTVTTETSTNEQMVWIPSEGSKYHSKSTCSGMKNPRLVPISEAIRAGYTACKRCY